MGLLIDEILAENGRVLGLIVGFGRSSRVVKLPEAGHRVHHAGVETLREDMVERIEENLVGVGRRDGCSDTIRVGGALSSRSGGDFCPSLFVVIRGLPLTGRAGCCRRSGCRRRRG